MAFHAIRIILQQPFLPRQSVQPDIAQNYQEPLSEKENCIADAVAITDLTETYRNKFTLKRATLLTSFSIYLALSFMAEMGLSQQRELKSRIEFLYSALHEAADASVYSLKEPLRLLKQRIRYTVSQNWEPETVLATMATPMSMSTAHYTPLESQRGSIDQDWSLYAEHSPQTNDSMLSATIYHG